MASKPETVFRKKVMDDFKQIPNSDWESLQQKSITGTPDVRGVVNSYEVALEFKSSREYKATDLQKYKLRKIDKAKGLAFVVYPDNWKEIKKTILKLNDLPAQPYSGNREEYQEEI